MDRVAFSLSVLAASLTPLIPPAGAAAEPAAIPAGPTACGFQAWPSHRLRAPLPVREAPSAAAPVLGTLPVSAARPDYPYSVYFTVLGTRPGWLEIAEATDEQNRDATDDAGRPLPPRPVFGGRGWIPEGAAQVAIQSGQGHARPDPASPRLLDLSGDWLTEMGHISAIRGCAEGWVLLAYRIERRRGAADRIVAIPPTARPAGTAWFRGICGVEETTCDMPSVDRDR